MSKTELYTYKCLECKKIFRTDDPEQKVCPVCQKYRQPNHSYRTKKSKPKILTFAEISHIAEAYNKIHHKFLHYGEIVARVTAHPEQCICCGEPLTNKKHICAKCERAGK